MMHAATRIRLVSRPPTRAEADRAQLSARGWGEARLDGVDGDCLAQAALFTALTELVTTYGEDATAKYAEGLPARIRNGEFSIPLSRQ